MFVLYTSALILFYNPFLSVYPNDNRSHPFLYLYSYNCAVSPVGTHKSKDHEMSISFWTSKSEIKYLYITMTGILVNQLNE